MRRIVGAVFQSLDGAMQAPGGPTEDTSGGFGLGGWMAGLAEPAVGAAVGALFAPPFALLLGRRTYDIFAAHWPYAEGDAAAMGRALTAADKHVLTRGTAPLAWANSHRLDGLAAVAALKASAGPDLLIQGSSTLYPALLGAGLLDRVTLMTFPVVLGGGKRIWDGPAAAAMRLVEHAVSPGGVVIAQYEPAGAVQVGSFAPARASAAEAERQARMARGDW